ncbi:DUF2777 domain-containing protein [Falsibacillus albus]|uniref:DUF2777 domain-containing protein n=1 Tax=Falsibacillus albus TaxID=2478915 RepID=A0A3L7K2F4_9BACI|nr:DUF2777 domain-containing protein [Falsibacillus albus]RLQ97236.1 DUF2777 domain-containing protein [Falsibacillus albus]
MNHQDRNQFLEKQTRAFTAGTAEMIDNQWVFFDEETDEASMLEYYIDHEIEVFRFNQWEKGKLRDNGKIKLPYGTVSLDHAAAIRIRKNLVFSLEMLLDDLNDDAFVQFITSLNSAHFSIYDCIYCHNHLSFLSKEGRREGVNFLMFDNSENICSVQHHFRYSQKDQDRFELTLNTGKRFIIEKFN